jgi:hydroxymethylpyrimidine/phosphomethylpyrimidine kinase
LTVPCALTIAGSDSGGGAGIQADLKTFAAIGVHGTSVVTCITAQNPRGVRSIQALRPAIVGDQAIAVLSELPPAAVKTGMLYSAAIIETVVEKLPATTTLIVDPVMVATSGAVLLKKSAIRVLKEKLLPRATLMTPNLHEAEFLLARKLGEPEEVRIAAHDLHRQYGCAVLVKGGHLEKLDTAMDLFFDGKSELLLRAPYIRGVSTHGTGCTYSAAVTAYCAAGSDLPEAVSRAKEFISNAIAASYRVGRHFALDSFWEQR